MTFRPVYLLDRADEPVFHCSLERQSGLEDWFAFAGFDQRPLDRRIDVVKEGDHVVALHDRAGGGGYLDLPLESKVCELRIEDSAPGY